VLRPHAAVFVKRWYGGIGEGSPLGRGGARHKSARAPCADVSLVQAAVPIKCYNISVCIPAQT